MSFGEVRAICQFLVLVVLRLSHAKNKQGEPTACALKLTIKFDCLGRDEHWSNAGECNGGRWVVSAKICYIRSPCDCNLCHKAMHVYSIFLVISHAIQFLRKVSSFLFWYYKCAALQVGAGIQAKIPQLPSSHSVDCVMLFVARDKRFLLLANNRNELE